MNIKIIILAILIHVKITHSNNLVNNFKIEYLQNFFFENKNIIRYYFQIYHPINLYKINWNYPSSK